MTDRLTEKQTDRRPDIQMDRMYWKHRVAVFSFKIDNYNKKGILQPVSLCY